MGFNSWNGFHCNVDENELLEIAQAAIDRGLAKAGYTYINIDDCWQAARADGTGKIIEDPARFPAGIAALTSRIHAMGMKFGLYTAQKEFTCQRRPGSWNYEAIDAQTYCDWGIDYIKIDQCFGRKHQAQNESWIRFREGISKCDHPLVMSVESCYTPHECPWIAELADLWRTGQDIQATFASVMENIHDNDKMRDLAKPGHYNDPDLLQIGTAGLSIDEQKTHFALWCIATAPLLASFDIRSASDETIDILTNPELIAVNQDVVVVNPSGEQNVDRQVQGTVVNKGDAFETWAKWLSDGVSVACVMVNMDGDATRNITLNFGDLGDASSPSYRVRDMWVKQDLGVFNRSFTATSIRPHASMAVKLTPA